jgi:uncharacterized protein (TIGR02996 family)
MVTPEPLREPASSPCQAPPGYCGEDSEGPCEANRAALAGLLRGIVQEPQAEDRCLVLADWLEEHDDPRRAELLRLHRNLLATCCGPEEHPLRDGWHARVVELLAAGVKPCVPQRTVVLAPGVEMTFSFIPPGSFLMGSPEGEEGRSHTETLHRVTLTQGFYLSVYPATQVQWGAVMDDSLSRCEGDDCPAEGVSRNDCKDFCARLGPSFRLPTEAEWEWACRAGTTTRFYTGDGLEDLQRAGWCGSTSNLGRGRGAKSVGQLDPNAWGLYDMHGNVFEWCSDRWAAYSPEDVQDPKGCKAGRWYLLRGGAWNDEPRKCRSAFRTISEPSDCFLGFGCRVVLCQG